MDFAHYEKYPKSIRRTVECSCNQCAKSSDTRETVSTRHVQVSTHEKSPETTMVSLLISRLRNPNVRQIRWN